MDDECDFSNQLRNSVLLQGIRWTHVVVLTTSLLIIMYANCRLLAHTIFDSVTLWYIRTLFATIGTYSIGLGVTQAMHLVARYAVADPCISIIPRAMCVFRMGAAAITPAFVIIHLSITVHQAISTLGWSLRAQKWLARSAIFVTFLYVLIFGFFSFDGESLVGTTQLCPFFNEDGDDFIIVNLNLMMVLDLINFATSLLLLRHNKKTRTQFDLTQTFRRVQIVHAMEQFIPMHILHWTSHLVHFGLYSFAYYYRPNYSPADFTIIFAAVNVMPYYCLLSPLAFLVLTKLGRFRRKDQVQQMIAPKANQTAQETYFNELKASWK